jgi:hypothetical protein
MSAVTGHVLLVKRKRPRTRDGENFLGSSTPM